MYMSKESFPTGLSSETMLAHTFQFIEGWKTKLFEMLTTGGTSTEVTAGLGTQSTLSHFLGSSKMPNFASGEALERQLVLLNLKWFTPAEAKGDIIRP